MASSFEIAGGGCKAAAFFGRDLPRRARPCFPSLRVNPPPMRQIPIASAALSFHPATAPTMGASLFPARPDSLDPFTGYSRDKHDRITPQKLDEWMRESVTEIVRNIGEAPFLVQIFSDEGDRIRDETESSLHPTSSQSRLILERESATTERWAGMKKRWEESCVPDGVILVEELCDDDEKEEGAVTGSEDDEGRSRKRWGVVIQGRGIDSPVCYILDTCRVRSSLGFCTHFCLVRAKCYGESVGVQFKKAWLLQEER